MIVSGQIIGDKAQKLQDSLKIASMAGMTRSSKAISRSVVQHCSTSYLPIDWFIPIGALQLPLDDCV